MSHPSRLSPIQIGILFALILSSLTFKVIKETFSHWFTGVEWLGNYSPVFTLALLGGMMLPRTLFWLPVALLAGSDFFLGYFAKIEPLSMMVYGFYAVLAFWGASSTHSGPAWTPAGTLGRVTLAVLSFYLLANTVAWVVEPGYAKTVSGWIQSQTVGLPQFPPSWVFLRNGLASEWLLAGLILWVNPSICRSSLRSQTDEASPQVTASPLASHLKP